MIKTLKAKIITKCRRHFFKKGAAPNEVFKDFKSYDYHNSALEKWIVPGACSLGVASIVPLAAVVGAFWFIPLLTVGAISAFLVPAVKRKLPVFVTAGEYIYDGPLGDVRRVYSDFVRLQGLLSDPIVKDNVSLKQMNEDLTDLFLASVERLEKIAERTASNITSFEKSSLNEEVADIFVELKVIKEACLKVESFITEQQRFESALKEAKVSNPEILSSVHATLAGLSDDTLSLSRAADELKTSTTQGSFLKENASEDKLLKVRG